MPTFILRLFLQGQDLATDIGWESKGREERGSGEKGRKERIQVFKQVHVAYIWVLVRPTFASSVMLPHSLRC